MVIIMKLFRSVIALVFGLSASFVGAVDGADKLLLNGETGKFLDVDVSKMLDRDELVSLLAHPRIAGLLGNKAGVRVDSIFDDIYELLDDEDDEDRVLDPIGDYEAIYPHESEIKISEIERKLLRAYLKNPNDVIVSQVLALFNLQKFYRSKSNGYVGQAIRSSVLGLFFLNRSSDLGVNSRWIEINTFKVSQYLSRILDHKGMPDASENLFAVKNFREAFTSNEKNRYVVHKQLLDTIAKQPGNAFANFYFVAVNFWNAGEEDYDEPAILNNMVLASYFAVRSIGLAEEIERLWEVDPVKNVRFRLANIVGGFSVFARRWLAKLHDEQASIVLLDDEHRQWYAHHKNFHAFTLAATFFHEEENFLEGFSAWEDATLNCDFSQRTCVDRPLFSYNRLSVVLIYVDHLLKIGDRDFASYILNFRYDPAAAFDGWMLGQESWYHRENNMDAIIDAYQNDDPEDDPSMFVMAKKKWGDDLIACQGCHQVQGRVWSEEEKNTIWLHDDSILTIGVYPEVSTKWYGATKNID